MPDPTKATVSATQIAALFNRSKWDTRWTLWKQFRGEVPDRKEDGRMSWGKKMQPLVLEQAVEDLSMDYQSNSFDVYERNGVIGATRDARVYCPDRGAGALEIKCVFDYGVWMRAWGGGTVVPFDYECQLQAQMFVGEAEYIDHPGGPVHQVPMTWGVIAAWVCGDMYYFERKPDLEFQVAMVTEARGFLHQVAAGKEPDPMGVELELPVLARSWGVPVPKTHLDLKDFEDARAVAEIARMYDYAGEQERFWKKTRATTKAQLLAASKDHEELALPGGVYVNFNKTKAGAVLVKVSAGPASDQIPQVTEFG